MSTKPNFTSVRIDGNDVVVNGVSGDAKELPGGEIDLLGVAVSLAQDNHVAIGTAQSEESWTATLENEAVNFTSGDDALLVGVEFRKKNSTITTWSQTLKITG